jgi:hypothetical protein
MRPEERAIEAEGIKRKCQVFKARVELLDGGDALVEFAVELFDAREELSIGIGVLGRLLLKLEKIGFRREEALQFKLAVDEAEAAIGLLACDIIFGIPLLLNTSFDVSVNEVNQICGGQMLDELISAVMRDN